MPEIMQDDGFFELQEMVNDPKILSKSSLPTFQDLEESVTEVDSVNVFDVVQSPYRSYVGIVMHHTYSPEVPIWERDYGKIINRYHYETNGWQLGLGYNFLITWNPKNENDLRIQASYRWIHQLAGAHAVNRKGFLNGISANYKLIGIGITSNFDVYEPSDKLYSQIKNFTDTLQLKLGIPKNNIFSHNQFDFKSCPGSRFNTSKLKD